MQTTDHTIEVLDSLLRGEISAVETYSHAIHKFTESPDLKVLEEMRSAHLNSIETLRDLITDCGGDPSTSSGPWGGFAKSVEAIAAMMGETAAMTALQQGEEHGINEYEDALEDSDVDVEVKAVIREELLPRLREHVITLVALTD